MENNYLDRSKSDFRYKPYPSQRPQKNDTNHHFNATLAKLQSLSESFKTLFTRFTSNENIDSNSFLHKSDCQKSRKKVQFDIIPNFLESENYEYLKDSYFYYSSSGISSIPNFNGKTNSIIKSTVNHISKKENDRWICSNCLSKNTENQEICSQCKYNKNKLNLNFVKTNSGGGLKCSDSNLLNQFSKSWKCIECFCANENSEKLCKNCRSFKTNKDQKINYKKEQLSLIKFSSVKKFNDILKSNKENLIAHAIDKNKKPRILKPKY